MREHVKKPTNTSPNVNVEGSGTDSAVTVRIPPLVFPEPLKRLAKVSPPDYRFAPSRPSNSAAKARREAYYELDPSKNLNPGDGIPAAVSAFSAVARSSAHSSQIAHSKTKS
jgi:hypothetical protein